MTARELLFKYGIFPAGGEMRRSIAQRTVKINDVLVTDPEQEFEVSNEMIIQRGKKVFNCIKVNEIQS